jgi:hypothetical protein
LPNQIKAGDIPNLSELKAQHAALHAPVPPAWDASDLEAQKAEWNRLHPAEPELEGEDLEAALAVWKTMNLNNETPAEGGDDVE